MMTGEQILPRGSPNALKMSALQGYSGKAWTDQPLGLCGWTTVRYVGEPVSSQLARMNVITY